MMPQIRSTTSPWTRAWFSCLLVGILGGVLMVAALVGGCAGTTARNAHWISPTTTPLKDIWSETVERLKASPLEARLVSFTCAWANDGSLFRISFIATDERGDSISVMNSREDGGSDELTLHAGSIQGGSPDGGSHQQILHSAYPGVANALSLIDAVGLLNLGQAVAGHSADADGYVLLMANPGLLESVDVVKDYTHGSLALQVRGGFVTPLEQETSVSSLGPVDVFVLWRADLAGNEARSDGPPIAYCFMQRLVGWPVLPKDVVAHLRSS